MKASADCPKHRSMFSGSLAAPGAVLVIIACAACGGEIHLSGGEDITLTPHEFVQQNGSDQPERPIVFILSGQSNMWGMTDISRLFPARYLDHPRNVTFDYAEPGSEELLKDSSVAKATHFGPEVSLIHLLSEKYQNRRVIVIKFAVGGTTIHHWNPNFDRVSAFIHSLDPAGATPAHYERLYEKLINYIAEAVAPAGDVEYGGMFWMQGESDAVYLNQDYLSLLAQFIGAIRRDLNAASLPFVLGRIHPGTNGCPWADGWSDNAYFAEIQHIRSEQMKLKHHVDHVVDVETASLSCHQSDVIHFNESSQVQLGALLYSGFLQVGSPVHGVELQTSSEIRCFGADAVQSSIIAYYNKYCYRCPDVGGLAYWSGAVTGGEKTLASVENDIRTICTDVGLPGMSECTRQLTSAQYAQCPSGWNYLPNYSASCFRTCQ